MSEDARQAEEVRQKLGEISYGQAMEWYAKRGKGEIETLLLDELQVLAVSRGRIRALEELLDRESAPPVPDPRDTEPAHPERGAVE